MKTNKTLKNYVYTVTYRMVVVVSLLITTPYVSRALGDEAIGIYTYTSTVANYFILFGLLGSNACGYREIAYAQQDIKRRSSAFWQTMKVRGLFCGISAVFFCVSCPFMQYRIYQGVWLIEIIANLLDISWFYNGIQEFRSNMLRSIIVKISSVILILLFIKNKNDLLLYIIIQTSTVLVGNLWMWRKMPQYVSAPQKEKLNLQRYLVPVVIMFLPQIIDSVYTMLDKLMLGQMSTIVQVGYYGQTDRIVAILISLANTVPLVYGPKVANSFSQNRLEEIPALISISAKFTFLISLPVAFGLSGIAYGMVPWFFGDEFLPVADLLSFYSMTIILASINSVMAWQYLLNTKEDKKYIITVCVGAMLDLIFNLLLIPKYNAMGAVLATVISMAAMAAVSCIFTWKALEKKKLFFSLIKPLTAAIIMFVLIRKISAVLDINIISTIIEIITGTFIYFVVLLLVKEETVWHYLSKYCMVLKDRVEKD